MIVRITRKIGYEMWVTCEHALFHGNPATEPAPDSDAKKGWMELIGIANQSEARRRVDDSYMYEGLSHVLIYDCGRMIQKVVF